MLEIRYAVVKIIAGLQISAPSIRGSWEMDDDIQNDVSVVQKVLGMIHQNKGEKLTFNISDGSVKILKGDELALTLNEAMFRQLDANEILDIVQSQRGANNDSREG